MERRAFILGASGAVGKVLLKELVSSNDFGKVVIITRRQLEGDSFKDVEQRIVDFDQLDQHAEAFQDLDIGFCCLGTTRGKSGAAGFVKVDHDYVVNAGKIAKENGCKHFLVVSSSGASATSPFLYPSTKGKMEDALKALEFDQLSIFRPAFLRGDRDEFRLAEKVIGLAMTPYNFFFPTSGSVQISSVARAMKKQAMMPSTGLTIKIFYNVDIHQMGQ